MGRHFDTEFFGIGPRLNFCIPGLFVLIGILIPGYSFYIAFSKDRLSTVDIMDSREGPDPLNKRFGRTVPSDETGRSNEPRMDSLVRSEDVEGSKRKPTIARSPPGKRPGRKYEGDYCPFCGVPLKENFDFCPKCGKNI